MLHEKMVIKEKHHQIEQGYLCSFTEYREEPSYPGCEKRVYESAKKQIQYHPCSEKNGMRLEQPKLFVRFHPPFDARHGGRKSKENADSRVVG